MIKGVIFDMDGVLASVSSSYRESIIKTCQYFNITISNEDIAEQKKLGNCNNDWILSKSLIDSRKVTTNEISLEEVTQVFEEIYQGTEESPGLFATETLIPSQGLVQEIYNRCHGKIAIVTGRPRKDCLKFLKTHQLEELFPMHLCICMEDGPAKPNPFPVQLACQRLNVLPESCIMIGDTPDDMKAAVSTGVTGYGVITPDEDAKLSLGIIKDSQSMRESLILSGATDVWKPGFTNILNILTSQVNSIQMIYFMSYFIYFRILKI